MKNKELAPIEIGMTAYHEWDECKDFPFTITYVSANWTVQDMGTKEWFPEFIRVADSTGKWLYYGEKIYFDSDGLLILSGGGLQ